MKIRKLICPICGKEKAEYDFVALKDDRICIDCAEKLVVAYPVTYYDNPDYKSDLVERRKGFFSKEYEKGWEDNGLPVWLRNYSGLEELSLEEYPYKLNSLEAFRMQIRRKYEAESVFQIQGRFPLLAISPFEIGIFEAKKYKNAFLYVGRSLVGEFAFKDAVVLIHEGKKYKTRVLGSVEMHSSVDLKRMEENYNEKDKEYKWTNYTWWQGLKNSRMSEGQPGYLILEKATPEPTAGNLILKL